MGISKAKERTSSMHMMRIRRTSLPTLLQESRLSGNVRKSTNNLLITIIEGKNSIWNVHILTEFPNKLAVSCADCAAGYEDTSGG
jgi:hypothetical protein